jgi:hypothetical protein
LGVAFAAVGFLEAAFFADAFGGKARDQESAVTIQARVASGFFCQPVATTT